MNAQAELKQLLHDCAGLLTARVVQGIGEFVEEGELNLALEELCSYIYEQGGRPSAELLERIRAMGTELQVDPSYWRPLES